MGGNHSAEEVPQTSSEARARPESDHAVAGPSERATSDLAAGAAAREHLGGLSLTPLFQEVIGGIHQANTHQVISETSVIIRRGLSELFKQGTTVEEQTEHIETADEKASDERTRWASMHP